MARNYQVEGTRSYFWWALGLLVVGLWFLRDGWFPGEQTLRDHPSPEDGYYLFNKIGAVILLSASAVCAYIHKVVK